MKLGIARFMTASTFLTELDRLRAFRGYCEAGLLESLESTGLVVPRLRIRYPDTIARRFWALDHPERADDLKHPIEPNGPRWNAALDFDKALYRSQNFIAYGLLPNPLDDPEPRFSEFIETPTTQNFLLHSDRRIDVSNGDETLYADNSDDRYSSWQLLLAAEQASAGIYIRLNLENDASRQSVREALDSDRLPTNTGYNINFEPVYAARDFRKHVSALDAVVWFAEERDRALSNLIKGQGGGRFRLSTAQNNAYDENSQTLALEACRRFSVSADSLIDLIRCFAQRWSDWRHRGRPLIANAYKEFLGSAVVLARRFANLSFNELSERVGAVRGWHKPALDLVWPDWSNDEKQRAKLTLSTNIIKHGNITESDIERFVEFLSTERMEAFFWRLNSFENHALRGNGFELEGMRSDIQGMAVVVEHIAITLGADRTQLDEKFKQLWKAPDVAQLLRRGDVYQLGRQKRLANDWPGLKAKIDALHNEPGGDIAADLVMAYRIRGGVHAPLPEDDHFELESLFTGLMRAALLTFVEVRGHI